PRQPAPYGAVLRTHFGGTFLFWSVLFVVCAVIAMRAIADERRQGTWEALLSAPVGEATVLAGKWLAAVAFVVVLWLPTLGYLGILAMGLPADTHIDLGPIASAYLGLVILAAGFLAIGIAASAATSNQIVAAICAWTAMMLLLVIGEVDSIAPRWFEAHAGAAAAVRHLDIRSQMDHFARGAVTLFALVMAVGITASALAVAHVLCAAGRRHRREIGRRALSCGLIWIIAATGAILVARHPHTWDLSRQDINTLAPKTRAALARISAPTEITVIRPSAGVFDPVYDQVDLIVDRMAQVSDRVHVRHVDPVLDSERMAKLAVALAIPPADLVQGGAVVFAQGGRQRAVDLLSMAAFGRDRLGGGEISELHAEAAFVAALVEVSATDRPRVCIAGGHGELAADGNGVSLAPVAERLRGLGFVVDAVASLDDRTVDGCRVVVIAGPQTPYAPAQAMVLAHYLDHGGRLLFAARSQLSGQGDPAAGLATVLGRYGVAIAPAVAVAPDASLGPGAWVAVDSYGDHPISAPFQDRRQTVWTRPHVVSLTDHPAAVTVASLVTAPDGFGETDVAALAAGGSPARDARDIAGPVRVAVAAENRASGARLVVAGSARSLSSAMADRGYVANARFAAASVAWLAGRTPAVTIGAKTPAHVRLIMTASQRRTAFFLAVIAIPLAFAGLGGAILWRRKRPRDHR
ncbi:MAG TPA: Gldg family protein, partial [Kofleriaceae bacterium]|nr:Gldg family protein [Kofleriaceae bacterium]